ncbi:Alpha/Beta hydrolase protein [Phlyctochytrium arcticum]|nr:Alpha/Beta hydrolase protein [Phlyctochytrium arcticum]
MGRCKLFVTKRLKRDFGCGRRTRNRQQHDLGKSFKTNLAFLPQICFCQQIPGYTFLRDNCYLEPVYARFNLHKTPSPPPIPPTIGVTNMTLFAQYLPGSPNWLSSRWTTTLCATFGTSLLLYYVVSRKWVRRIPPAGPEEELLEKYAKTHHIHHKNLRIIFIEHRLGRELPVMVFIHGMGAQAGQWSAQLQHFSQTANVLAVDLVGHGKSEKSRWEEAYTSESLTQDLVAVLEMYKYKAESYILVCHSYGCNLGAFLYPHFTTLIKSIIFLCPKAVPTESDLQKLRQFVGTPTFIIDLLRHLDRRGGIHSRSVNRLVGAKATEALRRRQLEWNRQHDTFIAKCVYKGAKWAPPSLYHEIACPVLLIGGEEDRVCPVSQNLDLIHTWLTNEPTNTQPFVISDAGHQVMLEQPEVVNAIIYNWLMECGRFDKMNLSYQLQLKNPSKSKWSLKNYAKWQKITPVAEGPVEGSLFRPMKTMKQDDGVHTPLEFCKRHPEIGLIIDISLETPPYMTEAFNDSERQCRYQKMATTSKIPPTREEVTGFSDLVQGYWKEHPGRHVAVHCHYGFNRTGFMICCYLIERCGVSVGSAIQAFAVARPPGIRHLHFKDELYMRYAASGMRSPAKSRY